jgi:hypothetical protein
MDPACIWCKVIFEDRRLCSCTPVVIRTSWFLLFFLFFSRSTTYSILLPNSQVPMINGYHQSFCASCRQCLRCSLRRNCQCTPLLTLDWSKDQTRDGALDFRKKKISRENNPRDFAAMKQHLSNENGRIDWSQQDEIIVNLCLNCDRKWRKFRDSFAQDHPHLSSNEYSSIDHQPPEPYSSSSYHPPPSAVEPSNVHYHSDSYNRPQSEVPPDHHSIMDSASPTSRKRRRRESAMSELQRLTSSNFGKLIKLFVR